MKWLLIAVGALMVVVGGSCVISGYPIVEVERGWALVISGATVASGGAIVFALGLALAKIESMARMLAVGMRAQTEAVRSAAVPAAARSTPEAPAPRESVAYEPSPREGPYSEPAHEGEIAENSASVRPAPLSRARDWKPAAFPRRRPPPESIAEAAAAAPSAPPQPTPVAEEQGEGRESAALVTAEAPDHPQSAVGESPQIEAELASAPESAPAGSFPDAAAPVEPQPASASTPEIVPEPEPSFRRFPLRSLTLPRGPWPDPPIAPAGLESRAADGESPVSPPEPEFVAPEEKEPGKATAEDWFERALASLDETQALERSAPHVAAPDDSSEESGAATGPTLPPATESAKDSSAEPPTILGRYETEGTVYVMYSDGSIDAETAGGVYRFKSLAALKAHIERPT